MPNGLEYALYASTPSSKVAARYWHGRKRVAVGRYTAAALVGGQSGDSSKIFICRLPAGAMVVGGQAHWTGTGSGAGLGANVQFTVGDGFDCDRFMTAQIFSPSCASYSMFAQCGRFNAFNATVVPLFGAYANTESTGALYEYTCETDIILYLTSGTATGHIAVEVEYVTE